jgi:uncharacterized protein (DUF433 family)
MSRPRTPRSFRLPDTLLRELQRHARETGANVTALVERYLDEGLRRDQHPLIGFRETAAGRSAALAGTRLDVWQVIETIRNSGNDVSEAAAYLEIPEEHVRACVRYYADHKREIDAWTRRMHDIAEREEEAWRREQAILV